MNQLQTNNSKPPKVLILTGTTLILDLYRKGSFRENIRRQVSLFRASSGAWLDLAIKLEASQHIQNFMSARKSSRFKRAPYRQAVETFFNSQNSLDIPELGEVVLATGLALENIDFEAMSYGRFFMEKAKHEEILARSQVVFISTTYLRDLSELEVIASLVKRPHNKVVAGGALAGLVHHRWVESPHVDILSVGYGELLMHSLCQWIKNGCQHLTAPETGRLIQKGRNVLLYSGVPKSRSLDDLPAPDWGLAQKYHGRSFNLVLYESVRGCPYQCGFCNYPFLFDDNKFRMRSAEKIADDWARLARIGVSYVSCLDSLFTMPKTRVRKLCQILIERKTPIKWICFARASDLTDMEICELLRDAGCVKLLIGVESGSQLILDNMNKRCTVDQNAAALQNCRQAGITTSASLIVGYPGETAETVKETFAFLKSYPPDIFNTYSFCVRSDRLPVLAPESTKKHGLIYADDGRVAQPYWAHNTLSCVETMHHLHQLNTDLMVHKVALNGSVFHANSVEWNRKDWGQLLEFQKDFTTRPSVGAWFNKKIADWANRRLKKAVTLALSGKTNLPLKGSQPKHQTLLPEPDKS